MYCYSNTGHVLYDSKFQHSFVKREEVLRAFILKGVHVTTVVLLP